MVPARLLSLFALASACAISPKLPTTETGLRGSLVIAGGGMSDHSALLRQEFLARRLPGPVGVIGAASSKPEQAARRGAAALDETAGGQVALTLPFSADEPDLAEDPEAVAMIEACGGLWFTGGSQTRIVEAMRPGGTDSAAWRACQALLARGGVIGGSSAGAAMMSDPMIRRGRSADAVAHGVGADGVELGQGMGFFPWGLCGQHFLERGRFGRMVVALGETGARFGWGVSEDSALLVDRATGWVETIGPCALTLFDMGSLQTSPGRWDGVHLALLGSGDRVHAPTGAIERAPSATPLVPGGGPTPELVIEELWGPTALRSACSHLAKTTGSSALLTDVYVRALLRHEERTSAWLTEEDGAFERPSISGLRLDLYRVTY